MSKKMVFSTRVITREEDAPEGFVRLCEIGKNKAEQSFLSNAHLDGRLSAAKLMRSFADKTGPVWVHRASAEELLAEFRRPLMRGDSIDRTPSGRSTSEQAILDALSEIARQLERQAGVNTAILGVLTEYLESKECSLVGDGLRIAGCDQQCERTV